MKTEFPRPEILSPAGDHEKLEAAIRFGADAVYLAGREFGMRQASENFTAEELYSAVSYSHERGVRVYLTLNTLPRADEYPRLEDFLDDISGAGIDGYIVTDLGVLSLLKRKIPGAEIHISTQASICSPEAARAWIDLGASRLVLARELNLGEIERIREAIPDEITLETFVHGSMCVSYSGRCLLSNMLNGRDANRGQCSQPCRWNYTLIEEKRPDTRIPVEETPLGTFIMSSKDMCMLDHVGELAAAGIGSFKIEGRVKSAYYAAVVTNAYKTAVVDLATYVGAGNDPRSFRPDPALYEELLSVSHREYCTGFYFDDPEKNAQTVSKPGYVRDKAYLAIADGTVRDGLYGFSQRNRFFRGDAVELVSPGRPGRRFTADTIVAEDGTEPESVPHPKMIFYLKVPFEVREGDILRAAD